MADQQMSPDNGTGPTPAEQQQGPIAGDPYQHNEYNVQPETPEQDQQQQKVEVELRDMAGMCVADAIDTYVKAGKAAIGANDSGAAKDFAQGVLSLTQAAVLLAPIEHNDQATTVDPSTALPPRHLTPAVSASFAEQGMPKDSGPSA